MCIHIYIRICVGRAVSEVAREIVATIVDPQAMLGPEVHVHVQYMYVIILGMYVDLVPHCIIHTDWFFQ